MAEKPVAQSVVESFRIITDRHYSMFYELLNEAIKRMGGTRVFTHDDEGIVASYLYILLVLVGEWSKTNNPFSVEDKDKGLSNPLFQMEDLYRVLEPKYKRETVRRYIGDLAKFKLIVRDGRGDTGWVRVTLQSVRAVAGAIKFWTAETLTIEKQLRELGAFPLSDPAITRAQARRR